MRTAWALTLAPILVVGAALAAVITLAAADAKKPAVYVDRVVEYKVAEGRDINPADPEKAGGDAFDLADLKVKLKVIRFVRITDLGNAAGANGTAGFDLDAVIAVHSQARKKD